MKEKIYEKGNKLIIEVPYFQDRENPYDGSKWKGDNIAGMIESEGDMGFVYRIDRSYKGKGDDFSDYFFKFSGTQEEFEKLCFKLGLEIVYY